jgi:hypothetical protein
VLLRWATYSLFELIYSGAQGGALEDGVLRYLCAGVYLNNNERYEGTLNQPCMGEPYYKFVYHVAHVYDIIGEAELWSIVFQLDSLFPAGLQSKDTFRRAPSACCKGNVFRFPRRTNALGFGDH